MAKKIISVLLAFILILGIAPVSLAKDSSEVVYDPDTDSYEQYGFVFYIYEDETETYCSIDEYTGTDDTIYIPKTLDGVEIGEYDIDARYFVYTNATAFSVDADNKYYSVKDGVLFSKDGTELIAYPNGRKDSHYDIPEGVIYVDQVSLICPSLKSITIPSTIEWVCRNAFSDSLKGFFTEEDGLIYYGSTLISYDEDYFYSDDFCGYCTVKDGTEKILAGAVPSYAAFVSIPDSVIEMYSGAVDRVIYGSKGSAAEKFAEENDIDFVVSGEGHEHLYCPVEAVKANCLHDGRTDFICPCGKTAGSVVTKVDEGDYYEGHDFHRDEIDGESVCRYCGITINEYFNGVSRHDYGDCDCRCHSLKKNTFPEYDNFFEFIGELFFRIRLVIWHLTGTHQYCECGKRHY